MNIDKADMQQLLRIFSHDLRNPLVNLRALLNDARASVDESIKAPNTKVLQEQLPETLDMFEESVDRMNVMIMGINDIYHAMYDELQCECVDMQGLFDRELRKLKGDRQNVEIVGCDLSSLWVDPLAMSQMLEALLNYSMNMIADDVGSIALRVEKRGVMDVLIIAVSCTLSVADVERVFDPFYVPYQQKSSATVVDLAMVKAWVESHGGSVRCESDESAGTVFYMALPSHAS